MKTLKGLKTLTPFIVTLLLVIVGVFRWLRPSRSLLLTRHVRSDTCEAVLPLAPPAGHAAVRAAPCERALPLALPVASRF